MNELNELKKFHIMDYILSHITITAVNLCLFFLELSTTARLILFFLILFMYIFNNLSYVGKVSLLQQKINKEKENGTQQGRKEESTK